MDRRPPKLQTDYALEVVRSILDSVKWGTWQVGSLIILFLVSLNLSSNSIYDILRGQFHCSQLLILVFSGLLVIRIFRLAKEVTARVNLDIEQTDTPQLCKALILFLSPPGADEQWLRQALKDEPAGEIRDEKLRQRIQKSWRMPIEAVAYHLDRLERIVVLPSGDSPGSADGTFRYLGLFRDVVQWIIGTKKPLQLASLRELNLPEEGVDFENAQALMDTLNKAFSWLYGQGLKDYEILVDVTGGPKVPTVAAGAAVALGEKRRFQYVSTRDYKVRTYDITYRSTP